MPSTVTAYNKRGFLPFFLIVLFGSFLLSVPLPTLAAANPVISFQGKIVDKNTGINPSPSCVIAGNSNDTCDFRASIYSDPSGGTMLWREQHLNKEIGTSNNVFNLELNSICNSWTTPIGSCSGTGFTWGSDNTVYLQIEFDTDGNGDFSGAEVFARKLITSVPYSLYSESTSADLDTIYTNDADKIINVNNSSGLAINASSTGDIVVDLLATGNFVLRDNGSSFLTVDNTGGFHYTLDATDNPGFTITNLGTSSFRINDQAADTSPFIVDTNGNVGIGTVAPSSALEIVRGSSSTGISITNSGSGNGIAINYNTSASDITTGLLVQNAGTSAILNAIDVSDPEIANAINLGTNNIVSSNQGTVSWQNTSGNELLQLTDIATNFGATVESGAMVSRNSYVGEEFARERADLNADGNQTWGDYQQFGVDENANCIFSIVNNTVNGIGRITTNAGGGQSCLAYHSSAAGVAHNQFNATNLPVIYMKVRPSNVGANDDFWVGIGSDAAASATDPTSGIYFTNNNGTNWAGITRNAGTSTTINCGSTISTTQFALLKIEVRSTSDVRFYVDSDVSDGIDWTTCGTSSTNIPVINLTSMLKLNSTANNRNLDIDFYRIWQDDNPSFASTTTAPLALNYIDGDIVSDLETDSNALVFSQGSRFTISNATGIDIFNLDSNGDVKIAGTLEATAIRAQRIEGLEIYTNTLNSLTSDMANINKQVAGLNDKVIDQVPAKVNTIKVEQAEVKLRLDVLGDLIVQKSLSVGGDSNFAGSVKFTGSTLFASSPKFNADTGGIAIIKRGADSVDIKYKQTKTTIPVTTVSMIEAIQSDFRIASQSRSGFTIKLNSPAKEDIKFNWISLVVESGDVQTSNPAPVPQPTPSTQPTTPTQRSSTETSQVKEEQATQKDEPLAEPTSLADIEPETN